jgi:hypothetical protein
MCEAIGHPVTHLKRIAIGPIRDSVLKLGWWRDLRKDEVERLRKIAAPESAARAQPEGHKGHKGYKGHKGKPNGS